MPARAPVPTHPRVATPQEAWWRYVERGRTHEVLASWRPAEGRFEVRETTPFAPGENVVETQRVAQPWEARLALWLLEARLSQLGEYWRERSVQRGWTRVGLPVNAPRLDLRPSEVVDPARVPFVHHYHDEHGGDTIVAALRAKVAERFVVIRARSEVGSLDLGRIDIVHAVLPSALLRSVVAREQVPLAQSGLPKLVTKSDYERAFGHGGDRRAARIVESVGARVRDGELAPPPVHDDTDEVYAAFLCTLSDPRLLALHHRFLLHGEEEDILAAGPPGIRKAIAAKRAAAPHHEQHLLTILEASLLARERMQSGRLERRDPEVRALTRLAYYL